MFSSATIVVAVVSVVLIIIFPSLPNSFAIAVAHLISFSLLLMNPMPAILEWTILPLIFTSKDKAAPGWGVQMIIHPLRLTNRSNCLLTFLANAPYPHEVPCESVTSASYCSIVMFLASNVDGGTEVNIENAVSGLSNNLYSDKIYGGNDTIKSVDKHGTVLEVVYARIRNM